MHVGQLDCSGLDDLAMKRHQTAVGKFTGPGLMMTIGTVSDDPNMMLRFCFLVLYFKLSSVKGRVLRFDAVVAG